MNPDFFEKIQPALAVERLDAYRQDQAEPLVALARYLWNMALCESLYPPLQMVEIALRNALQRSLESHFRSPYWYDVPSCWQLLTITQQSQIVEAKQNLARQNKLLGPGRIVAELTFGFRRLAARRHEHGLRRDAAATFWNGRMWMATSVCLCNWIENG